MPETNSSTLKALEVLELLAEQEVGSPAYRRGRGHRLSDQHRAASPGESAQEIRGARCSIEPVFFRHEDRTLQARSTRHRQVIRLAYPFLKRLQQELDETVDLGILSERSVVYVETLVPESALLFYVPPGPQMPLHCTAMGKLSLAYLSPESAADLVAGSPLRRYTEKTVTDPVAFPAVLAEIRRCRYAIDDEEYAMGVRCGRLRSMLPAGHVVVAVSVTALATSLIPDREAMVRSKLSATGSGYRKPWAIGRPNREPREEDKSA